LPENQWRLFEKKTPHRVKPLLYIIACLLTGIHMMRSGQVETNLLTLNEELRSPQVAGSLSRARWPEPETDNLT
jgi:predicted nucleotidyltransferase